MVIHWWKPVRKMKNAGELYLKLKKKKKKKFMEKSEKMSLNQVFW